MASKDNQPKEFTTLDGKRYRKTVDKKGKSHYTVFDVNKKTNKFIDAKEFVRENSRFHAKERIRNIKEEADRKKREEDEAKASAILAAERKKKEAEFEKARIEATKRANEKKRQKKDQETLEQAKELSRFLNAVSDENDLVAQMTNKLLDHHDESLRVSYWRGLSKQFLRLSEEFKKLDRKFSEIYEKVRKKKRVEEIDIKEFDSLVMGSDPLFKKFESLIIEAANRKDAFLKKEAEKAKKRKDKKRAERIEAIRKGREEKSRKIEEDKIRQLEEVEERNKQELFDSYDQEKQRRLSKREKSDKFFSSSFDDLSRPTKALIGGSKLLGGVAMAPLNVLGLDFRDELDTLNTLFSPIKALGSTSLGLLKSGTQRLQGIDDKSIERLEDVFTNPGLGKKKKVDPTKVIEKLNKPKSNQLSNFSGKISSILGAIKPFSSNVSNTKNIFNNSNSNRSNSNFVQSTISNRPRIMGGLQSQVIDLNRTDDKDDFKQGEKTNQLLEQILKAIRGEDKKNLNTKKGLFGGGNGKLGLVGSLGLGLGVAATSLFGAHKNAKERSKELESSSIVNQLKEKKVNASTISTYKNMMYDIDHLTKTNDQEKLKSVLEERKEFLKMYGITENLIKQENVSKIRDSVSETFSDSSSFRNSQNNSSIIKAEINKIEKINDAKQDLEKIADKVIKFFGGDFIDKLVNRFISLSTEKKRGNSSVMPPMQPF